MTPTSTDSYDVFISCKSEDYSNAGKIYDFLVEHGFRVFLASKELRILGESEYRRAISQAMKSAYHMIVFASKAEYIDSTWVYYEWDMFVNAKLKGFKQGNIFTILDGVKVDDINMDLWKYESMTLGNYRETLLNYVETPAHKARAKELEASRREAEERERLKRQLVEELDEYNRQSAVLHNVLGRRIAGYIRQIGLEGRKCPVCDSAVGSEEIFCGKCGWRMSPVDGYPGLEELSLVNTRQLDLYRKAFGDSSDQRKQIALLQDKLDEVRIKKSEMEHKLQSARVEIEELRKKAASTPTMQKSQVVAYPGDVDVKALILKACSRYVSGNPVSFDFTKLADIGFAWDKLAKSLAMGYFVILGQDNLGCQTLTDVLEFVRTKFPTERPFIYEVYIKGLSSSFSRYDDRFAKVKRTIAAEVNISESDVEERINMTYKGQKVVLVYTDSLAPAMRIVNNINRHMMVNAFYKCKQ